MGPSSASSRFTPTRIGEDLSNYFYLLESPPDVRGRAAIGRGFLGSEFPAAALRPDVRYFACLKVWAMYDHNSVCVAQMVHEDVLTTAGAWRPDAAMRYGTPLGPGPFYQGIYINDLLLLQKVRKGQVGIPAAMKIQRFSLRLEPGSPVPACPGRLESHSNLPENSSLGASR